jgi:AAA domain
MSDEVYRAIANARSGFVEAPAGCGKTEAIVRTVGSYCNGRQLILTHTHAGVDALRARFRCHSVSAQKFHVDTIAGWAWGWVRRYPANAGYNGSIDIAEWNRIYAAMAQLLTKEFVRYGVLNSYAGVIVDEYQDCTAPMHNLIVELKRLLPCRVLGDDLQGIFGFRDDPLVAWLDMKAEFANDLGTLDTPHRWVKADNEKLGRWLLRARPQFREAREPDYRESPVRHDTVTYSELGRYLVRLSYDRAGRICVVGPKTRRLSTGTESTLVNKGFRVLAPNDLNALRELVPLLDEGTVAERAEATTEFIVDAHGGWPASEQDFIANILSGTGQRPRRADRVSIYDKHRNGVSVPLLLDLLVYIGGLESVTCKLRESISALKCILESHMATGARLKALYAEETARRKYQSRSNVFRCIGSTLLVKGLEFDHVVVLRDPNWERSWGTYKDLYVALSRGSRSSTLVDLAR